MLTDYDRTELRRLMEKTESLNINGVRDNQLDRRVNSFARRAGITTPKALLKDLSTDPSLRERFIEALTINVTNLFRNAEQWKVVQEILSSDIGPRPRIWSAGCSTGAEAYTISIIAREINVPVSIVATDIDRKVLEAAERGWYGAEQMREVPKHLISKHFRKEGDGWTVHPSLRSNVRFSRHDLLADPPPTGLFDMITCRNVAIYFSNEAKDHLHERLSSVLKPGGVVFIGGAERITRPDEYGLQMDRPQFYRKRI